MTTYYPTIPTINFEGNTTTNKYAFRHYNADAIVGGKTMKEQLRFAICYWHTMTADGGDPFGAGTMVRNWEGATPMETAHNRVDAFFELLTKLGVELFCFHDADIAPAGDSLEEWFANLDEITDHIKTKMDETGIKLLWNTHNAFSHPRFANGAGSSNKAEVFAYTAAQVKKGIDLSKKLNGTSYVFWGGREGYESLLNTDIKFEQDNIANLWHMAVDYGKEIGHLPQFFVEPKPKEPTTHQYDFDAATTMSFLQAHDLTDYFQLNIEANHATLAGHTFEHELHVARTFNALGSIDANQGNPILGWDTDEFPVDVATVTLAMVEILENGGLPKGGVNFDAKVRRTSIEMDDLVLAHIAGMDTFARGLKNATALLEDKFFENMEAERYASWKGALGQDIRAGKTDLKSLTAWALENGDDITLESNHIEYYQNVFNDYLAK
ncbi:MAG: xylose isomerase [Lactobacillales bacterium]|jgi:xylose isomerase|nr:xylose isomerase [Lactobacillales bacterium]